MIFRHCSLENPSSVAIKELARNRGWGGRGRCLAQQVKHPGSLNSVSGFTAQFPAAVHAGRSPVIALIDGFLSLRGRPRLDFWPLAPTQA